MTQSTLEKDKIQSLEGLRGLMAWWVVFGHVSLSFGWNIPGIDHNTLAVDVFIILSGFVITRLILLKKEPYGAYITRRAFRIFPLYLLVLFVSAALLGIQGEAWNSLSIKTAANLNRIALTDEAIQNFPAHLAAHLLLLQGLIPSFFLNGAPYTIVGQAWSVSLEWQFYLIAPLLVFLSRCPKRIIVATAIVVILVLMSRLFAGAFLGSKIFHFLAGMLTAYIMNIEKERRWVGMALLAATAILITARDGFVEFIPLAIWAVVTTSMIWPSGIASRILSPLGRKLAVHFGELSYSIYLVHMIPLYVSVWILTSYGISLLLLQATVFVVTIFSTYLIARITYAYIERYGIKLGARITSPSLK